MVPQDASREPLSDVSNGREGSISCIFKTDEQQRKLYHSAEVGQLRDPEAGASMAASDRYKHVAEQVEDQPKLRRVALAQSGSRFHAVATLFPKQRVPRP